MLHLRICFPAKQFILCKWLLIYSSVLRWTNTWCVISKRLGHNIYIRILYCCSEVKSCLLSCELHQIWARCFSTQAQEIFYIHDQSDSYMEQTLYQQLCEVPVIDNKDIWKKNATIQHQANHISNFTQPTLVYVNRRARKQKHNRWERTYGPKLFPILTRSSMSIGSSPRCRFSFT